MLDAKLDQTYQELKHCCQNIEKRWSENGKTLESFPCIVLEETTGADFRKFADLSAQVSLLEKPEVAELQEASTFSDLYLKIYDTGTFWVEILNWWGSDISIHDHDFSGIQFQLSGRSLNVMYDYVGEQVSDHLCIGETSIRSVEIWEEGSRSLVRPGRVDPHNVSHLDIPTVSMLIRTHPRDSYAPQYNYLPPTMAASYNIANLVFRKKIAALRLLASHNSIVFAESMREIIRKNNPRLTLFTVMKTLDFLFTNQYEFLLREIIKQDTTIGPYIVKSAAIYHSHLHLSNTVKKSTSFSPEQYLALSALTTVFDKKSFQQVVNELNFNITDIYEACSAVVTNVSRFDSEKIIRYLSLIGIENNTQKVA